MKTDRITVVPDDKIIIKNGVGLIFDFESPKGVHAVQWANGKGHVEYTDGSPNRSFITVASCTWAVGMPRRVSS